MPADNDSALLPGPPPPRPAAREAAIEAAMRRFDGVEDKPATKVPPVRSSWTRTPQFGLLVTASLVAVIGIPAAFIAIQNADFGGGHEPTPAVQEKVQPSAVRPVTKMPTPEPAAPVALTPSPVAPAPAVHRDIAAPASNEPRQREEEASTSADALAAAAPPPPPPPPPSAPAPAEQAFAQKATNEAAGQNIVVTGSLIQTPKVAKRTSGGAALKDESYAPFLTQLQAAVRSGDQGAVIKLVGYPLRVNYPGGSRIYRDAASVRRDYEQIFTARVEGAILSQRSDQLFVRDQGAMIGGGQVWFDRVSASGPVRIRAINP